MRDIPPPEFNMAASTPGALGLFLLQVGVVWLGIFTCLLNGLSRPMMFLLLSSPNPRNTRAVVFWTSTPLVGWWCIFLSFQT